MRGSAVVNFNHLEVKKFFMNGRRWETNESFINMPTCWLIKSEIIYYNQHFGFNLWLLELSHLTRSDSSTLQRDRTDFKSDILYHDRYIDGCIAL